MIAPLDVHSNRRITPRLLTLALTTLLLFPALLPATAQTARVQIIHNSPYEAASSVDIYANDSLLIDDLSFRQATRYLDVPADSALAIDVTAADAADNSEPVFSDSLVLADSAVYIVIAAGDPAGGEGQPPFDLFVYDMAHETSEQPGNVEGLFFHGSPDAPTIDVVNRDFGVLIDDFAFGDFSGYAFLPPDVYTIDITPADDNDSVLASFEADITDLADSALTVAASGFLSPPSEGDPDFGLLAVYASGTATLLSPASDTTDTTVTPPDTTGISVTLIDAVSDEPIEGYDPISNGATLDLADLPLGLNLRANVGDTAQSVVFTLNGTPVRTENDAPFSLFGDVDGDFAAGRLPIGSHTLMVTTYGSAGGMGDSLATGTVSFTVIDANADLTGFMLVDADTDEDLMPLEQGDTLSLNDLPPNLNVRALANDDVLSVRFELNDSYTRLENVAPFALFGDLNEGDYLPGTFSAGTHTLTATSYRQVKARGPAGAPLAVTFTVEGTSEASKATPATGYSEEPLAPRVTAEGLPAEFALEGNYPNPFNPVTTIRFALPEAAQVRLEVYDMLGRRVMTLLEGRLEAGWQEVSFRAEGLPSGAYVYRLQTPEQTFVRKMILLK